MIFFIIECNDNLVCIMALFAIRDIDQNHNDQPAEDPWQSDHSSTQNSGATADSPITDSPDTVAHANLPKGRQRFVDIGSFFQPLAFSSGGLLPETIQVSVRTSVPTSVGYNCANSKRFANFHAMLQLEDVYLSEPARSTRFSLPNRILVIENVKHL